MAYAHCERLTALDASFLVAEDHAVHMHVGSVGIFGLGGLAAADGGLDMERIWAAADRTLATLPRFRQRLAYAPVFGSPVWVDDEHFNLRYHIRHTALPHPGDERQLKRLAGRIMSQQLDRAKPLWEMWYVEGLPEGRFAVVSKIHHCMVDGISSVDLMGSMMSPDANAAPEPAPHWRPRPAPTPGRLFAAEVARLATLPLDAARGIGHLISDPRHSIATARQALGGLGEALAAGLVPASATSLNCPIGPHRRFDWLRIDLDRVKRIKNRHGATINDVVLAIVAGALRRFLRQRGEMVDQLTFRAMIPVNLRGADEHDGRGNRVSFMIAPLPLSERAPADRLRQVVATTQALKRSQQRRGGELIEQVSDRLHSNLFGYISRLSASVSPFNVIVTNVPGPQLPLYMLGAPLRAAYPLVPLFANQALGIALFSYDGGLFWGFNADWDAMPDLHDAVAAVEAECATLGELAAPHLPAAAPPARERRAPSGQRARSPAVHRRGRRARRAAG
jgi:diacylglycerol O-acyltransferase